MKALILAAGKGSRLGSLTHGKPKPMIEFQGKPILQHNIEKARDSGFDEIFINLHTAPNCITEYFGDGKKFGVTIEYAFENELLGTSGAINNFDRLLQDSFFAVIYGDNLSDISLTQLLAKHREKEPLATISFHYREDTRHSGVAEFDKDGFVLKFIEKPLPGQSESHWVNAGIYILDSSIIQYIPLGFSDFGKDIFPLLIQKNEKILGDCQNEELLAFDTPEMFLKHTKK